ncbi:ATP-binding/permease protein CydD [Lentibacillus sp. JNUCC-1]|nr:ATP-binding/permease protein CydD [Lentibacillus sp. JNUCC-1]
MRRHHVSIKQKRRKLYQHVTDALFGQLDWLVSGRVSELFKRVEMENNSLIDRENRVHQWHHLRDALLRLVSGIMIILTMVWVSGQTDEGAMSATVIAAFALMMFSVTDALMPTSDAVEELPSYRDSIHRMNQLAARENNNGPINERAAARISAHPSIHLKNVTFGYDHVQPPVIDQLNLSINSGEKVALLGKSGAGKSTLLKLMSGVLEPAEGQLLLDDAKMDASFLSKQVAVLNQHPHLFNTTVANNVRIGQPDATEEEEIINVLRDAQMMDMIETLPEGIHTKMEEMGKRFSGGERHRIAFARLLLQDTPIILLDEPTTGLDPLTEQSLLETMLHAARNKTVVLVTHHLAGAELMDNILFIDKGGIKMAGSHDELMETSDYYRTLYAMDSGVHG